MPVRVVIGEDDVLLREGLARILDGAGLEVVAQTGRADDLLRRALAHQPDVAASTSRCRPAMSTTASAPRSSSATSVPKIGVVVLSQFFERSYAVDLIGDDAQGVGYLLKERVGNVSVFVDAVCRVAAGGTALDSVIVGRMLGRSRSAGPLDDLTPRELEVLAEMAEGKSNRGSPTRSW